MAVQSLSDISASLNLVYGPQTTDNFRMDTVLPLLLRTVHEANSTCTWDVRLAGRTTAAAKAQGYDVQSSDFSAHQPLQATIAWAHYEAYASITGTAARIAAANGRWAGTQDRFLTEVKDAGDELAVKLSTHSYSGDYTASPVELAGLAQAIDATGTYAGLAPGSYPTWISAENTDTLANLTLDILRTKILRPYKDLNGVRPKFCVCPGAVMDKVFNLFDQSTRIVVQTVRGADGKMVDIGALGFTGVMVDGVPFIEDRHCTTGTIYAFDPDWVEYVQVPPVWLSMDPGMLQSITQQVLGSMVPLDQIIEAQRQAGSRLIAQINALGKLGDSTRIQLVLDAQLRVRRRQGAAKLTLS